MFLEQAYPPATSLPPRANALAAMRFRGAALGLARFAVPPPQRAEATIATLMDCACSSAFSVRARFHVESGQAYCTRACAGLCDAR